MKTTENQLVIAVSSRALFNLEKEHEIFEHEGIAAYRSYQQQHKQDPLEPGMAFPFIKRLLELNNLFPGLEPFRVVVLSPTLLKRDNVFSVHADTITFLSRRGAFTSGQSTFPYLEAFDASLFLSANKESVNRAIRMGQPAGWVVPGPHKATDEQSTDKELRIAFDFDGVIVDDEAEREFQKEGLEGFQNLEIAKANTPHAPGPLHKLFKKLAKFQTLDACRGKADPYYKPALRVSIVTARGAPSEERLITTLRSLGMSAAELFLLDGLPKSNVLKALKPHIFFDDQISHLEHTSSVTPSVLVPFGVHNFN